MIKNVKRGDIYYYNFGESEGSVQGGIRPALVIQGDAANEDSSTTVIATLTSRIGKRQKSHIILGSECGLKRLSVVQLEQVRTVNKCNLLDYVGSITDPVKLKSLCKAQIEFYDLKK